MAGSSTETRKKMRAPLLAGAMILLIVSMAHAIERVPITDVDADAFSMDTQIGFQGVGEDHMAFAWWIPREFWEVVFSQDETMTQADLNGMMEAVKGTSLLAVVQADISYFGAFNYYSKDEIEGGMTVSFTDETGKFREMKPLTDLSADLELMLSVFTPILGAAMGDLGNNMHFFVMGDEIFGGGRLMDPYEQGILDIEVKSKSDDVMPGSLVLPVNSLYVPRQCPNGKDAHVSWVFCPWTGEKLPE
jgi:hypothetical protein